MWHRALTTRSRQCFTPATNAKKKPHNRFYKYQWFGMAHRHGHLHYPQQDWMAAMQQINEWLKRNKSYDIKQFPRRNSAGVGIVGGHSFGSRQTHNICAAISTAKLKCQKMKNFTANAGRPTTKHTTATVVATFCANANAIHGKSNRTTAKGIEKLNKLKLL